MDFKITGTTTTSSSSSSSSNSSSSMNGKVTSSSSHSTSTKTSGGHSTTTKKGKKTMGNGDVIEYETSGNVTAVEFDPSNMNNGFSMEFNATGPPPHSPHTPHGHTVVTTTHQGPHGQHVTYTETHTTTSPKANIEVNAEGAQAVAHAAMMGVANLFAPKPQVVVKETHTVYVPAPTQQIVYQAPPQEEVEEEVWECVGWSEGTHCCCRVMDPEKAKVVNARKRKMDREFSHNN